jgi:hypothetical protein
MIFVIPGRIYPLRNFAPPLEGNRHCFFRPWCADSESKAAFSWHAYCGPGGRIDFNFYPELAMIGRKFKHSMLEYSKLILYKFTFDKTLFRKEYRKALRHLDKNERSLLSRWVRSTMAKTAGPAF